MTEINVLFVDDNMHFLYRIHIKLNNNGVNIFSASSKEDILQKLILYSEIEVVILDVNMSVQNGMEMLRMIKKEYPLVEVIMLTDHKSMNYAIEGMRLGAEDYILKDSSSEIILEKIKNAVQKKRDHEEKIIDARFYERSLRLE